MDVETFLSSLLEALSDRPFVQSVDLETEAVVVRGRVLLEQDHFLQVYFNEETGTTAFALTEDILDLRGRSSFRLCSDRNR